MTEWERDGDIQRRSDDDDLGGTMRLGAYDCKLSAQLPRCGNLR